MRGSIRATSIIMDFDFMRYHRHRNNSGMFVDFQRRSELNREKKNRRGGFTLVEMLVSTAILVLILVMTLQIVNYTTALSNRTRAKVDAFQSARAGFEAMTRKISQATLNTYSDYDRDQTTFLPKAISGSNSYVRQSELHFVSGPANDIIVPPTADFVTNTDAIFFQIPSGYSSSSTSNALLPARLNAAGYYIEFSSDQNDRPSFLTKTILPYRYRFRLKEFFQPTENFGVYLYTDTSPKNQSPLKGNSTINWWYNLALAGTNTGYTSQSNQTTDAPVPTASIAENIIALVISPQRSPNYSVPSGVPLEIAPDYFYDTRAWAPPANSTSPLAKVSRNQLPPMVQVTMVAIDEPSAARLNPPGVATVPTFTEPNKLPGGLNSLFKSASNPSGAGNNEAFRTDLQSLEDGLTNLHIAYRVFSTNVSILQARWSDDK